jgi:hypothetical protein
MAKQPAFPPSFEESRRRLAQESPRRRAGRAALGERDVSDKNGDDRGSGRSWGDPHHRGWGDHGGGFGGLSLQSLEGLVGAAANRALKPFGVEVTIVDSGGASGGTVIESGIGVDISYKGDTIDLQNLSLDVKTGMIAAKVVVDGHSEGEVGLLQLGADGTIGLTSATADAIDLVVGHDIVSASTVINLGQILSGFGRGDGRCGGHSWSANSGPTPITGGETLVVLPGGPTLEAHGVKITALGSAALGSFAGASGLLLPITGGTETASGDTTLHAGSGVELAYKGSSIELQNFIIDDTDGVVQADVTLAGHNEGLRTVLDINADGALTLTKSVAGLIDHALGSNVVSSSTVIGGAYSVPLEGWGCGGGSWTHGGCGHHWA